MIEQQVGQRILMPDGMSARVIMPRGAAALPWWLAAGVNPLAAYQAKGAASYAASKVNLYTPGTYNLTDPAGAVNWSSAGWSGFSPLSRYLDTGIVPVVANPATWSMFVQFTGVANTNCVLAGGTRSDFSAIFQINPNQAAGTVVYGNGGSRAFAPALTLGNLGFAGNAAYRNGIAEALTIPTGSGIVPTTTIGALHLGALFSGYANATIIAVIIYNVILLPAQAALIVAAMAAL